MKYADELLAEHDALRKLMREYIINKKKHYSSEII